WRRQDHRHHAETCGGNAAIVRGTRKPVEDQLKEACRQRFVIPTSGHSIYRKGSARSMSAAAALFCQCEEFRPLSGIRFEIAEHCGSNGFLSCDRDSTGFHAHVAAADNYSHGFGLKMLEQRLCYLLCQPLLNLKTR